MIFLFFGSSIAHLEPELQRFEDRSIYVGVSATQAPVAKPDLSTAVTWALDEQ